MKTNEPTQDALIQNTESPKNLSRRGFVIKMSSVAAVVASGGVLTACGGSNADVNLEQASFNYGIASGDPLSDRVILWTYAKVSTDASVDLQWQVATDATFSTIVSSGKTTTTKDTGFTAKVDATGLSPNTEYYYRFIAANNSVSAVGRTRTLPVGNVSEVKLAVFSCSDYPAGYFNAYDSAISSGAQFSLHLGDYIYEYKDGVYPPAATAVTARISAPANEVVTLADYRARHALHKADPYVKALHARMPMIAIWDDHEFANNAYMDGAENHDPVTQGPWAARKAVASQVYHEWMPIRTPDPTNLLKIYRSFDFGNLLSLHMLDTRIIGREHQPDRTNDASGRDIADPAFLPYAFNKNKQLMGATQQAWLDTQMTASKATWQVLGNQTVMGRIQLPASVLSTNLSAASVTAYLTAKATPVALQTQAQKDLLDLSKNPKISYNFDNWEGYPNARDALFTSANKLKAANKKFLVLSGDSHNAWFNKLTLPDGTQVGAEFAGMSVTSSGFEGVFPPAVVPPATLAGTIKALVDDINYIDTSRRGYMLITVNQNVAKGDYIYVSSVTSSTYTTSTDTLTYAG
ncbi:alkaline phosphatase D family protein [Undibacterium sp. 5I1]|uniref:alkaline phosphatase D family protein n=1 Tax=unclassified Undibacterium TaxID=2630295 RepID=UPI002AB3C93D|nr:MULTISPECIES: alkaline phosphatase D family protein [unclassified Undibacterium]MDY7539538.1 alkaline phosphatase D family protein [Undibacterium sp. 5I1]MEB0232878.1 alkaline phosphatase D family protein [Undibacterium sp. 10I3]MEB0258587.1 alkaline phosphatase D family protein [Undibacterium sp. 5I1]